ncbi:MAG: SWIM zinc finger family protein [Bifidobacteriaceae bacterium]|nr:SWIM zinc finger family protein [Bifidobacteriaceae bacterium]
MWFELGAVEAMAPDAASLKAGRGLAKPARWPTLGAQEPVLWGECQGSGANPYQVAVDNRDLGYRCSCPSRKFPCKHSLALMLIASTQADAITEASAPEWVSDWLGRRRTKKTSSSPPMPSARPHPPIPSPPGHVPPASDESPASDEFSPGDGSPSDREFPPGRGLQAGHDAQTSRQAQAATESDAKRAAAAATRRAATQASVAEGLDELEDWIDDQLRLGLTHLIKDAHDRCRRIAARLVDHKATALASRLDEFPARLAALPAHERPELAVRELGQLALLAQAWQAQPNAPHLDRAVITAQSRTELLEDPQAQRVVSLWEVAGSRIFTRRDRLISHATWLINLAEGPPFALLQDYYPAASGARGGGLPAGRQIAAELVYYPGGPPLRAVISEQAPADRQFPWPGPGPGADRGPAPRPSPGPRPESPAAVGATETAPADPLATCRTTWANAPWEPEAPLLGAGEITNGGPTGQLWWTGGPSALPLARQWPEPLVGSSLLAFGIWNGARLDLLAAQSPFGPVHL